MQRSIRTVDFRCFVSFHCSVDAHNAGATIQSARSMSFAPQPGPDRSLSSEQCRNESFVIQPCRANNQRRSRTSNALARETDDQISTERHGTDHTHRHSPLLSHSTRFVRHRRFWHLFRWTDTTTRLRREESHVFLIGVVTTKRYVALTLALTCNSSRLDQCTQTCPKPTTPFASNPNVACWQRN